MSPLQAGLLYKRWVPITTITTHDPDIIKILVPSQRILTGMPVNRVVACCLLLNISREALLFLDPDGRIRKEPLFLNELWEITNALERGEVAFVGRVGFPGDLRITTYDKEL